VTQINPLVLNEFPAHLTTNPFGALSLVFAGTLVASVVDSIEITQ